MEFRFRADEDKTSPYFSPSSSDSYFTKQALRAGYLSKGPLSNDIRRTDFVRNSDPVREAIQRELEKERIREEIIAAEIARKQALEAEVRRELAMERDLALGRAERFSLVATAPSPSLWSEPRLPLIHHADSTRLEDRLSFPLARPEVGVFERLPFQRRPESARVPEVKALPEVSKGQVGQLMFLAKPMSHNLSGTKRKAGAGAGELALVSSKKKTPKEWSCALCQVSATSEQGLNDHLQGKKHKAKEAELRENRTASRNTGSSTPLPKKTDKPKLTKTSGNPKIPNPNHGKKQEGKLLQDKKQHVRKNGEASLLKKQKIGDLKKKKFKLWCEHCHVGCNSETVMAAHRSGKKHMAQVQGLKQNCGDVPAIITTITTETIHGKAEDATEEENEESMENVDGLVYGVEDAEEPAKAMEAAVDKEAEAEGSGEMEVMDRLTATETSDMD